MNKDRVELGSHSGACPLNPEARKILWETARTRIPQLMEYVQRTAAADDVPEARKELSRQMNLFRRLNSNGDLRNPGEILTIEEAIAELIIK